MSPTRPNRSETSVNRRILIHLCQVVALALGLTSCKEPASTGLSGPKTGGGGGVTTGQNEGGGGGSTDSGAGGLDGGGAGVTGGGGTNSGTTSASGGSTAIEALDIACTGDKAFEATGLSFSFPTPADLGGALGTLVYDPATHPITIVLRADKDMVTASAADGEKFVVNPPGGTVSIAQGGFSTESPQATGLLRLVDPKSGVPIDIVLENVTFSASTYAGCSYANVLLEAIIPVTQAGVTVPVDNGTKNLGQLAGCSSDGCGGQGGQGGGLTGWPVRAFFQAQTTSFDFASMEPSK